MGAPKGKPGEWLLDPLNIRISQDNTVDIIDDADPPNMFVSPSASGANVSVTDIENALNQGGDVRITTDTDVPETR